MTKSAVTLDEARDAIISSIPTLLTLTDLHPLKEITPRWGDALWIFSERSINMLNFLRIF